MLLLPWWCWNVHIFTNHKMNVPQEQGVLVGSWCLLTPQPIDWIHRVHLVPVHFWCTTHFLHCSLSLEEQSTTATAITWVGEGHFSNQHKSLTSSSFRALLLYTLCQKTMFLCSLKGPHLALNSVQRLHPWKRRLCPLWHVCDFDKLLSFLEWLWFQGRDMDFFIPLHCSSPGALWQRYQVWFQAGHHAILEVYFNYWAMPPKAPGLQNFRTIQQVAASHDSK